MRLLPAVIAITVGCLILPGSVHAQRLGETVVGQPVSTSGVINGSPIISSTTVMPASAGFGQAQILPYSYWVSYPGPARVYVDYGGSDQFPFYGRAYGSPGDRWSWYTMGGGDSRYLARYYYQLLR